MKITFKNGKQDEGLGKLGFKTDDLSQRAHFTKLQKAPCSLQEAKVRSKKVSTFPVGGVPPKLKFDPLSPTLKIIFETLHDSSNVN